MCIILILHVKPKLSRSSNKLTNIKYNNVNILQTVKLFLYLL